MAIPGQMQDSILQNPWSGRVGSDDGTITIAMNNPAMQDQSTTDEAAARTLSASNRTTQMADVDRCLGLKDQDLIDHLHTQMKGWSDQRFGAYYDYLRKNIDPETKVLPPDRVTEINYEANKAGEAADKAAAKQPDQSRRADHDDSYDMQPLPVTDSARLNGSTMGGFASGKGVLTDTQKEYWKNFAQKYKDSGSKELILLNGYADGTGSRKGNLAIGQKRAEAVQQYLATQGVTADVGSGGQSHPTDATNKSNDADRRVTAYVGTDNINAVKKENEAERTAAMGQNGPSATTPASARGGRTHAPLNGHMTGGWTGEDGSHAPAAGQPGVTTQSAQQSHSFSIGEVSYTATRNGNAIRLDFNHSGRIDTSQRVHNIGELGRYLAESSGFSPEQVDDIGKKLGIQQQLHAAWEQGYRDYFHTEPPKAKPPAQAPAEQASMTPTKLYQSPPVTPTPGMVHGGPRY